MSFFAVSLGFWALSSTYDLYTQDKAYVISRHYSIFLKADNPEQFVFSVLFHAILGIGVLVLGVIGVIAALYKTKIIFPR